MNNIRIREANELDLSIIKKLTIELLESIESKEGIDAHKVLENCRKLLSDAHSYIPVAEMGKAAIGFINFTIRQTLLHPASSGF